LRAIASRSVGKIILTFGAKVMHFLFRRREPYFTSEHGGIVPISAAASVLNMATPLQDQISLTTNPFKFELNLPKLTEGPTPAIEVFSGRRLAVE
jgi:hypothetical protein